MDVTLFFDDFRLGLFLANYIGFQLTRELMMMIVSAVAGLFFLKIVYPVVRALKVFSMSLP